MTRALLVLVGCAALVPGCKKERLVHASSVEQAALVSVDSAGLCATHGSVDDHGDGRIRITDPSVRAVAPDSDGESAELRFRYLGDTDELIRLGSGTIRRQLGLKLRAQDSCNVVYIMWRVDSTELVVSVKANPNQRLHRECGTAGYRNLEATTAARLPALESGSEHTLSARLSGDRELIAEVDGEPVWRGTLGPRVDALSGPAGLRTDNVRLEAELLTTESDRPLPPVPGCEDRAEER